MIVAETVGQANKLEAEPKNQDGLGGTYCTYRRDAYEGPELETSSSAQSAPILAQLGV
jgi:hypothetical protein